MKNALLVGIGGFAGSIARYYITILIGAAGKMNAFPWGTLSVNIIGSLLIGIFIGFTSNNHLHLLLAVGFCGGFTTFSSFSLEALHLFRSMQVFTGMAYVLLSIVTCIAAVFAGFFIVTRIANL